MHPSRSMSHFLGHSPSIWPYPGNISTGPPMPSLSVGALPDILLKTQCAHTHVHDIRMLGIRFIQGSRSVARPLPSLGVSSALRCSRATSTLTQEDVDGDWCLSHFADIDGGPPPCGSGDNGLARCLTGNHAERCRPSCQFRKVPWCRPQPSVDTHKAVDRKYVRKRFCAVRSNPCHHPHLYKPQDEKIDVVRYEIKRWYRRPTVIARPLLAYHRTKYIYFPGVLSASVTKIADMVDASPFLTGGSKVDIISLVVAIFGTRGPAV